MVFAARRLTGVARSPVVLLSKRCLATQLSDLERNQALEQLRENKSPYQWEQVRFQPELSLHECRGWISKRSVVARLAGHQSQRHQENIYVLRLQPGLEVYEWCSSLGGEDGSSSGVVQCLQHRRGHFDDSRLRRGLRKGSWKPIVCDVTSHTDILFLDAFYVCQDIEMAKQMDEYASVILPSNRTSS